MAPHPPPKPNAGGGLAGPHTANEQRGSRKRGTFQQPDTQAQPASPREPAGKPGEIHLQRAGSGLPHLCENYEKITTSYNFEFHRAARCNFNQGRVADQRNLLRIRLQQQGGARAHQGHQASSTSRDPRNPSAGQFWIRSLPASNPNWDFASRAAKLSRYPCASFSTPTTIPVDHHHERSFRPQQHSQCRLRTALDAASAGRSSIDDLTRALSVVPTAPRRRFARGDERHTTPSNSASSLGHALSR